MKRYDIKHPHPRMSGNSEVNLVERVDGQLVRFEDFKVLSKTLLLIIDTNNDEDFPQNETTDYMAELAALALRRIGYE
jgi:hypothetical protein